MAYIVYYAKSVFESAGVADHALIKFSNLVKLQERVYALEGVKEYVEGAMNDRTIAIPGTTDWVKG